MSANRTVMVLGASGFIGRHLCETLASEDLRVLAATRRPTAFSDRRIRNVAGTFDTPNQFNALLDACTDVVHAASSSTPGSSAGDPMAEVSANLLPTLALLDAMQSRAHLPLVYLSSGGTLYGDRAGPPFTEAASPAPRSFYGAAKASAEAFVSAWAAQAGGRATILRPSNVYGPQQWPRKGFGVIPAAMQCALDGTAFTLIGDDRATRDYLYIDDFIAACRRAIDHAPSSAVATYNVAQGQGVSLGALLDEIDRVTGRPLQRILAARRAVDVHRLELDCAAIKDAFGWQPTIRLGDGLERTWRWFSTKR